MRAGGLRRRLRRARGDDLPRRHRAVRDPRSREDFADLARLAPEARRRYATALEQLAAARAARTLGLRVCAEGVEEVADAVLVPWRSPATSSATATTGPRYAGQGLIDRAEALARLEPPGNAAAVHDRMVRALSAYAQA